LIGFHCHSTQDIDSMFCVILFGLILVYNCYVEIYSVQLLCTFLQQACEILEFRRASTFWNGNVQWLRLASIVLSKCELKVTNPGPSSAYVISVFPFQPTLLLKEKVG
jgi:hypothetical protein